ncbi:MAG: CBS domain-containing protein, partial [Acidobacteria bacterium]|nr:CBS domain-containing protein [Acidobacteriota bacterium]
YGIVGMGAMAAAVLGAPISTILIVFELTGDFSVTVAVMIAVAVASLICRRAVGGSYFTLQLADRGVDLSRAPERVATAGIAARDLMTARFRVVDGRTSTSDLRERLDGAPDGALYVVDARGLLVGMVPFERLCAELFAPADDRDRTMADLADTDIHAVEPADGLDRVLALFESTSERQLPVVESRAAPRPVGVVRHEDALAAYNRALLRQHAVGRGQT